MDIAKINFAMTYLTGVAQNWFEVGLNQEDQSILQDWLSDCNLFVDKLHQYFGLSDPVGEAANMLDNLRMKPSNKFCAIAITRGSPIRSRIPFPPGNKENPPRSRICTP